MMELAVVLEGSDALEHLEAAHKAAWVVTDRPLLELCRDRLAMLIDHPSALQLSDARRDRLRAWAEQVTDPVERAALTFTEQYTLDVASVTDDQVEALRAGLDDQGLVDFLNALLVVEQRMRLEMVWEQVL